MLTGCYVSRDRGSCARIEEMNLPVAETDSLFIWWIDNGRLTLANARGVKNIRVTRLEGELALRAWYGGHGAAV